MEAANKVGAFFVDNKGNSYWSNSGKPTHGSNPGPACKPTVCRSTDLNIFNFRETNQRTPRKRRRLILQRSTAERNASRF